MNGHGPPPTTCYTIHHPEAGSDKALESPLLHLTKASAEMILCKSEPLPFRMHYVLMVFANFRYQFV